MRVISAIVALSAAGLFVGCSGFVLNNAANQLQECEGNISSNFLQQVLGFEMINGTEQKIANTAVLIKLDRMANTREAANLEAMKPIFEQARSLNEKLLNTTEKLEGLLRENCDQQRGNWLFWSFISMIAGVFGTCFGFWIGLRATPTAIEKPKRKVVKNA